MAAPSYQLDAWIAALEPILGAAPALEPAVILPAYTDAQVEGMLREAYRADPRIAHLGFLADAIREAAGALRAQEHRRVQPALDAYVARARRGA